MKFKFTNQAISILLLSILTTVLIAAVLFKHKIVLVTTIGFILFMLILLLCYKRHIKFQKFYFSYDIFPSFNRGDTIELTIIGIDNSNMPTVVKVRYLNFNCNLDAERVNNIIYSVNSYKMINNLNVFEGLCFVYYDEARVYLKSLSNTIKYNLYKNLSLIRSSSALNISPDLTIKRHSGLFGMFKRTIKQNN